MKEIQGCRREFIGRSVKKRHKERKRRLVLSNIYSSLIWDLFKVHWWVWENWTIMALIKTAKRDLIVNWMSRQPQILLFIWIFITVAISSTLRAVYSVLVHRVKRARHKNYYAHYVRHEAGEARKKSLSFFFSGCPPCLSRLAARARARALPLLNLKKKRDCSQSNFL